jgi:hypothetical protein
MILRAVFYFQVEHKAHGAGRKAQETNLIVERNTQSVNY